MVQKTQEPLFKVTQVAVDELRQELSELADDMENAPAKADFPESKHVRDLLFELEAVKDYVHMLRGWFEPAIADEFRREEGMPMAEVPARP